MDYAALKTEITTDPKALGYAPYVASGSDGSIADLLNAMGTDVITIPDYTKEQFSTGIIPAVLALATASTALQSKWDRLLSMTLAQSVIHYSVAAPLLSILVSDGLITQSQIDAFTKRPGSRAEVLFGAGTVISSEDVAKSEGR